MQQLSTEKTNLDLMNKVNEHYQEKAITKLLIPPTGPRHCAPPLGDWYVYTGV